MRIFGRFKKQIAWKIKSWIASTNQVGSNVVLGRNTFLEGATLMGNITLGEGCRIYHTRIIGTVEIGLFTSLWGPNLHLMSGKEAIRIGNFCSIARNTSFQGDNHETKNLTTYHIHKNILDDNIDKDITSKGPIEVGNDVWIGMNCSILSGVKIGHGAVIGAGSVVVNEIPPYAIAGGVPARVIRYRFEQEEIKLLLKLKWWDWDLDTIIEHKNIFSDPITSNWLYKLLLEQEEYK